MATSDVDICNRALDALGADPIASLDDDTTSARRCKRQYPLARDAVLRGYEWNCALRRASLPAEEAAPDHGYLYAYNLPAGGSEPYCLRVVEIEGERDFGTSPGLGGEDKALYKVEGRQILTDQGSPLNILYIARVEDASQYDALLADAIAARLRADLAYAFTGSPRVQEEAQKAFREILAEARRADAREGAAEPLVADDWLKSRI